MKIRFRLIRTEILLRESGSGSGFLKPHSGRPLLLTNITPVTGIVLLHLHGLHLLLDCIHCEACNLYSLGSNNFFGWYWTQGSLSIKLILHWWCHMIFVQSKSWHQKLTMFFFFTRRKWITCKWSIWIT